MATSLAPTSFELPPGLDASVSPQSGAVDAAETNKVLVIGSLNTAGDQSYQNLVKSLEETADGKVERQLWDRVVAGATTLAPGGYASAHILLAVSDIEGFNLADLLGPIADALSHGGDLYISGLDISRVSEAVKSAGFTQIAEREGKVTARKTSLKRPLPASESQATEHSANGSVPLKLRRPGTNKSTKASIWALKPSADTALIDDSTLLSAEDLARPTLITKPDCDVKKTRKACKNCTCGLRELELEEDDDLPEALKDAVEDNEAKLEAKAVKGGKGKKTVKSGAVTSSCGSCYLGDAFRCSGCPYLGLPAFEPGQKVVLTAEMGDDI